MRRAPTACASIIRNLPCGADTLIGGRPAASLDAVAASIAGTGLTSSPVAYRSTSVQRDSFIQLVIDRDRAGKTRRAVEVTVPVRLHRGAYNSVDGPQDVPQPGQDFREGHPAPARSHYRERDVSAGRTAQALHHIHRH